MKTHHKKRMPGSKKDSPLLRKMLQQASIFTNHASAAWSSQDDPMRERIAAVEPLDLRIKKVERTFLQTKHCAEPINDRAAFPPETSLRYFLRSQQGEKEGLWSIPPTDSPEIYSAPQASMSKPWPGEATEHPCPRASERSSTEGLHSIQRKSSTTLVKFFHGRGAPPIFSRVLELESLPTHSGTTELPINEIAPEKACSKIDHAKSSTHPDASSKPSRFFSIKRCDASTKHRLLPEGASLENGLNVVLQEEVRPQENEQLTSSGVVQTLPLKKRKRLWSSSLKEYSSAEVDNKRKTMASNTDLPRQAFFTSNVSTVDFVSSDEDSLASNPLEIDFDRPDTP